MVDTNPILLPALQIAAEKKKNEPKRRFAATYRDNPVAFVHDCFSWREGESPTDYQDEIMEALAYHKRVSVRGPHGLGKTALSSWTILWFALTRDGEDWKAPTTASAWRQLTKFLWPEIHKWARRVHWSKVPRDTFDSRTELLQLSLKLNTGEAFAVASDTPDLIEGAHADHLLYLFDESKAISHETFNAAEGAFSGAPGKDGKRTKGAVEALALAVSTPGDRAGHFYDIQRRAPGYDDWWVRHITLEETIKAGRVTREWAEQRKKQWGETSPVFQAKVLGEFPEQGSDTLINLSWIEDARQREFEAVGIKGAGVDVARFGEDDTVEIVVQDGRTAEDGKEVVQTGSCVVELEAWNGNDLMQSAGRVRAKGIRPAVDTIGVGAGLYDRLREDGFDAISVNVGEAADDKEHFANLRAELYWRLREDFREGRMDLSRLPQATFDRLCGELAAIKYEYTPKGQIKIEAKDDLKKRLNGQSPDFADALMLTRSMRQSLIGIAIL